MCPGGLNVIDVLARRLIIAESPRWYIKKNRYEDAFKSLCRLRTTPLQAARDLYYIHAQVRLEEIMLGDGDIQTMRVSESEKHFANRARYMARFRQLFTIARVRRATLATFVVMIAQQMCGSTSSLFAYHFHQLTRRQSISWPSTLPRFSWMQVSAREQHSWYLGVSGLLTSRKWHAHHDRKLDTNCLDKLCMACCPHHRYIRTTRVITVYLSSHGLDLIGHGILLLYSL